MDFRLFIYKRGEGRRQPYHAFVMVLSYLRMMFVELYERQDLSSLIRCHIRAFEAL